jgi:hypothetical protein
MPVKGGDIAVDAQVGVSPRETSNHPTQRDDMGSPGKNSKLPDKEGNKSKEPPPKPVKEDGFEDVDFEDGDFATPKRDREDEDNQPL